MSERTNAKCLGSQGSMSFKGEPYGLEGPGHLPGDIGLESLPKGAVRYAQKNRDTPWEEVVMSAGEEIKLWG